jgi:hypothetical protein
MIDTALYLYMSVGAALFVLWDATRRKAPRLSWVAGTVLAWPLVLPLWLATRPLRSGEIRRGGRAWNILRLFALAWSILWGGHFLLALGLAVVTGVTSRSAADRASGVGLVLLLAAIYVVVWLFPALGALGLGWLLRKPEVTERGPA